LLPGFFLLISISFVSGWVYGFKRLPPTNSVANALRKAILAGTQTTNQAAKNKSIKASGFQPELIKRNPDIVFLGDSLTRRFPVSEIFSEPSRIYNRGVEGDTTTDILNRIDQIQELRPKNVYLMIGINDLWRGSKAEDVAKNIYLIHDKLSKSGAKVFVQKTIQCQPSKCTFYGEVNRLNTLLSSAYGSKLVELGELNSVNGLSGHLTYDGIHLNSTGYSVWSRELRRNSNNALN